jgi:hypothetical protein
MAAVVSSVPLEIGQVVCRRTEPLDTANAGVVGGLIFLPDRALVVVRWHRGSSTFEPEETLVHGVQPQP